jgi:hypothetical protein
MRKLLNNEIGKGNETTYPAGMITVHFEEFTDMFFYQGIP